jgi:hypothetical protein
VSKDVNITGRNLPLQVGAGVKGVVLPWPQSIVAHRSFYGAMLKEDDPFGPATSADNWEALNAKLA